MSHTHTSSPLPIEPLRQLLDPTKSILSSCLLGNIAVHLKASSLNDPRSKIGAALALHQQHNAAASALAVSQEARRVSIEGENWVKPASPNAFITEKGDGYNFLSLAASASMRERVTIFGSQAGTVSKSGSVFNRSPMVDSSTRDSGSAARLTTLTQVWVKCSVIQWFDFRGLSGCRAFLPFSFSKARFGTVFEVL